MPVSALLVLTTAPSLKEARKIASTLLDLRLAACVTVSAAAESHYDWKGKRYREREFLLFIKSTKPRFARLRKAILNVHSYETPEVLALPVTAGSKAYLQWLAKQTR